MRHGTTSNNRRQRSRGNGGGGGARRGNQQRAQVFDSNGPDVRIRGTAHQVCEKYLALSKDAHSSGDRILAESYMQHAEHYQRLINQFESNLAEDRARHTDDFADAEPEEISGNHGYSAPEPRAERPAVPQAVRAQKEDDLGLPSSILGGDIKAKTEASVQKRTPVRMGAEIDEAVE